MYSFLSCVIQQQIMHSDIYIHILIPCFSSDCKNALGEFCLFYVDKGPLKQIMMQKKLSVHFAGQSGQIKMSSIGSPGTDRHIIPH